jgi:hypothetical protein
MFVYLFNSMVPVRYVDGYHKINVNGIKYCKIHTKNVAITLKFEYDKKE